MSTREESSVDEPVIESRDELVGYFASGEKPAERWRIGTEHEKFVYWKDSHRAPSYEERGGIHAASGGGIGEFELPDSTQPPRPLAFSL